MITVRQPLPAKPTASPTTATPDLYVCPFVVAVDTREQAPWTFQGIAIGGRQWIVKRQVQTLQTGDYSIVGCEDRITIERKSPDDLLGTITAGNARFRAEHERMQAMVRGAGEGLGHFACVIVEGCLAAICDELDSPTNGRRVSAETVLGITAAWPQRYGVHWFFAGDRRRAELLAFKVLWKWWDEVGKLTLFSQEGF